MKALGERLALDHRNMSAWYELDIQTNRTRPGRSRGEARRRPAADLEQPARPVMHGKAILRAWLTRRFPTSRSRTSSICSTRRTSLSRARSPAIPPRASRCTPSTAARTCSQADAAQKLGAVALRALDEHAPDAATLAAALGLDAGAGRAHLPARRRQADARAGRGLPHRLRGRLRQPARRRGGRPRARRRRRGRGRPDGRHAAAVHRHPHQAAQRGAQAAQPAHARSVPDRAARATRRRAAAELRRHAAEDHRARAGRGAGVGLRRVRGCARTARPGR